MSTPPAVRRFEGRDGLPLVYREVGEGRPLLLIHGYFSTATVNWIKYGHADEIASRGFRVVMPDLRAHGDSAKPHDAASYPRDVLADDAFALLDHLGWAAGEYDLAGYSLGGRTALRLMVRGARPGRAVIAGTGTEGVVDATGRGGYYRDVLTNLGTFERGSSKWRAEMFLRSVGGDPEALVRILDTFVDTSREQLAAIEVPTLVAVGVDDDFHDSAVELARILPHSELQELPGDHMGAVAKPELGRAVADYLSAARPVG